MAEINLFKFEKFFFSIIDFIFHPIFIPFYSLYTIIHLYSQYFLFNSQSIYYLLIAFFIITILLPLLVFLILRYYTLLFSSVKMNSKTERLLSVLIMQLFYVFAYFYFTDISFFYFIEILFTAFPLILAFLLILQIAFYKISMHTYAIGSFLGIILFYRFQYGIIAQFYLLSLIFIFIGLITSSRLLSGVHNFKEVLIGFFSGFFVAFVCMLSLA